MGNRIPGPADKKNRPSHGQFIKAMAKIHGKDILPQVKMPRKGKGRGKDKGPRKKEEAIFRVELIKYLRRKSCKVWRIENSLPGYRGLPDLWVASSLTNWAGWIELKSKEGKLRPDQFKFKMLCELSSVNHIVARDIGDCDEIFYNNERR